MRRRILLYLISSAVALGVVLLVALALETARAASDRAECNFNLRQLIVSVREYADVRGHYPPATVPNKKLTPGKRLSWFFDISYYIEGGGPWIIDRTRAWDEGVNRVLKRGGFLEGRDKYRYFHCPAHEAVFDAGGNELTSYVGIAGLGTDAPELPVGNPRAGVFGFDRLTPLDAITDGTAMTFAVAETTESNGPWKAGGPATVRGLDPSRQPYIGPSGQFGGTHRGGAMVAFVDGSVRFIRATIDPKVFEALSTIAGGESLPTGWDR